MLMSDKKNVLAHSIPKGLVASDSVDHKMCVEFSLIELHMNRDAFDAMCWRQNYKNISASCRNSYRWCAGSQRGRT